MKNLLIIGARGFGREVYNLYLACKKDMPDLKCKGFLDDKTDALDTYPNYPPIISSVEEYQICPNDVFICALGDVKAKRKYVEKILEKGGEFISLIHPAVNIGLNTKIGKGCIIRTQAEISCDIIIGDYVTIMGYSLIGHDCHIGNWSHLGAHTFLGGFSIIKEMVTIHPNSKILPHKIIEDNAIIGAGSVVIKKVSSNTTVFGVPAKKINL